MLGAYLVLLPIATRADADPRSSSSRCRRSSSSAFWFGFQLWEGGFSIVQPQAGGGVAFFAHIGGFAFGVLTVRLFMVRPPLQTAVLMTDEEFEEHVRAALDSLPDDIAERLENVAVVVEDESPDSPRSSAASSGIRVGP